MEIMERPAIRVEDIEKLTHQVAIRVSEMLGVGAVDESRDVSHRSFENTEAGRLEMLEWLPKFRPFGSDTGVRILLLTSGQNPVDLASALRSSRGIEVDVVNLSTFASVCNRNPSETDQADARQMAHCGLNDRVRIRMPASTEAYKFRDRSRLLWLLTRMGTRLKRQLRAAGSCSRSPACSIATLQADILSIEERKTLELQAMKAAVRSNQEWARKYALLLSVQGIGNRRALAILAEFVTLQPNITSRSLAAYSGLDPFILETGRGRKSGISKMGSVHLRRALFMPALIAIRCDPYAKQFFKKLRSHPRYKSELTAIVAVERKLLTGINGMFKSGTPYDGKKLFQG